MPAQGQADGLSALQAHRYARWTWLGQGLCGTGPRARHSRPSVVLFQSLLAPGLRPNILDSARPRVVWVCGERLHAVAIRCGCRSGHKPQSSLGTSDIRCVFLAQWLSPLAAIDSRSDASSHKAVLGELATAVRCKRALRATACTPQVRIGCYGLPFFWVSESLSSRSFRLKRSGSCSRKCTGLTRSASALTLQAYEHPVVEANAHNRRQSR